MFSHLWLPSWSSNLGFLRFESDSLFSAPHFSADGSGLAVIQQDGCVVRAVLSEDIVWAMKGDSGSSNINSNINGYSKGGSPGDRIRLETIASGAQRCVFFLLFLVYLTFGLCISAQGQQHGRWIVFQGPVQETGKRPGTKPNPDQLRPNRGLSSWFPTIHLVSGLVL